MLDDLGINWKGKESKFNRDLEEISRERNEGL